MNYFLIFFLGHISLNFNNKILVKSSSCIKDFNNRRTIEASIEQADVIIAGQVRRVDSYSPENHTLFNTSYGAFIQINRIIKGQTLLYDILNRVNSKKLKSKKREFDSILNKNNTKQSLKRTKKYSIIGNMVYVKNFGNLSICVSRVEQNDFRIFLLSYDSSKKSLMLDSSLVESISKSNVNKLNEYQIGAAESTELSKF
jgi:hypothetical protein